MSQVTIYTRDFCGFSVAAKNLLDQKGVPYEEINATGNAALRAEMNERTGGNTFPQVIINGQPTGGCTELFALEESGDLDRMLRDELEAADADG